MIERASRFASLVQLINQIITPKKTKRKVSKGANSVYTHDQTILCVNLSFFFPFFGELKDYFF